MDKYGLDEFNRPAEELFSPAKRELYKDAASENAYSYWKAVGKLFFSKRINRIFLILLGFIIIFSFVYPCFSDFDRFENIMDAASKHLSTREAFESYGFGIKWLFGSGANGEAVFDSVWQAARLSLSLAFLCAAINMTIGVFAGLVWGYVSGLDAVFLQMYYVISNVPHILIVSVIMMLMSSSFLSMVFALTATGWLSIAYDIRNQVLIIRNREYNLASVGLGSSTLTIVRRNILPHLISVIVTLLSQEIPSYISYEVFLSYIGIGIPELSLGRLIYESEKSMFVKGWMHEFWWPVATVCLITLALYVTGQQLGDASDPKNHR